MASKNESTAINKLIDLVQENQKTSKPIVHPDDDLFAVPATRPEPAAKKKAPRATAKGTSRLGLYDHVPSETSPAPRMKPAPQPRGNTIPPLAKRAPSPSVLGNKPMTATFSAVTVPSRMPDATPAPELAQQHRLVEPKALATVAPLGYPVVQRPALPSIDMTKDAPWFEVTPSTPGMKFEEPTYVGTSPHVKQERDRATMALAKKLILPGIGFIVLGAMIGGFIAFNGDKKPAAPAAPAAKLVEAPVPSAPAASAPPAQPVRAPLVLADVRIDSVPAGALVTLVDEKGKATVIGSTPIAASVDPAHQYDVTLALGAVTKTVHLDPAKEQKLAVEFDQPRAAASAPKRAQVSTFKSTPQLTAAIANAFGEGTLMISSKPPCEILIDGKPTGLSTPQRAMALPAGAHKVTLVNAAEHIEQTMMVQIAADKSTKLVKDLLAP